MLPTMMRRAPDAAACLVLLVAGCGGPTTEQPRATSSSSASDSIAVRETTAVAAPPDSVVRQPRYRAVRIPDRRALKALRKSLGPERFLLTLKVNRRDSLHVRDSLMVPDSSASLLDLSPFPHELPSARDLRKLALVSRRVQAFAAYEQGRLVRWGPTSTGRESLQTPEGLYHTNWKDKVRTSTFNDEWLLQWYVNLENYLGISFHLFEMPGYPASHSCIRLLEDDAIWLYQWADQWTIDRDDPRRILENGTPVVVFGRYAYGRKPPWRELAADSTATNLSVGEIDAALESFLRSGRPTPIDSLRIATWKEMAARAKAPADSTDSLPAPVPPPPGGR